MTFLKKQKTVSNAELRSDKVRGCWGSPALWLGSLPPLGPFSKGVNRPRSPQTLEFARY